MSHAIGAVRFDDGAILFYEYNGTGDWVVPNLYTTSEAVHEHWRDHPNVPACPHDGEPVEILSTYGGGFRWLGRACRECMRITAGFDAFDDEACRVDGYPDWTPFPDPKEPK